MRVSQGRPFEDSTAYDETCGVPDDIASMSRRYGAGGKNNLLLGKAEHLFRSPFPSFFAQCTPKYNSQAPHAIVACITPGSCQMYSIIFVSPFAFLSFVIVSVVLSGVHIAADSIENYNQANVSSNGGACHSASWRESIVFAFRC